MRTFARDQRGLVAIEFGIVASLLVPLLLSVADIGQYLHRRLQVEGLAVATARAISSTCSGKLPALSKCAQVDAVIADIRATSSLDAGVGIAFDEGSFCVTGKRLARHSAAGQGGTCPGKSANTNANGGTAAGDYVIVTVSYTVAPLFLGTAGTGGVGDVLPNRIVRTAMLRLQ